MSNPRPHRYDSGVYFDTYPGEAIGCCERPQSDPIHDVACNVCGTAHQITYDCVLYGPIRGGEAS